MAVTLRRVVPDNVGPGAQMPYEGFRDVASRHGVAPVFATVADAANVITLCETRETSLFRWALSEGGRVDNR